MNMDAIAFGFQSTFSYESYVVESGILVFTNCVFKVPFPTTRGLVAPGTFIEQISVDLNIFLETRDGLELGKFQL